MGSPDEETYICFDPNGDRSLTVGTGNGQKRFQVSSKAMCLASPVWKAMFTGGYMESTTEQISFPEADPNALSIALRIAHLQFKDLPSSLNFTQLLRLAAICDEYDLVKIVRPFLSKWTNPFERLALKKGYPKEWLLVAWTFGDRKVFERITCEILLQARTNADGVCMNEKNEILEKFMPSDIIDSILRTRNSVIAKIIDMCHNHLNRLKSGTSRCCQANIDVLECDSLTLGSLVRGLAQLGLGPGRPDPSEIHMSISDLILAVLDIQIHTYPEDFSKDIINLTYGALPKGQSITSMLEALQKRAASRSIHHACSIKKQFNKDIKSIAESIPSAVLDPHLRHLEVQSEK